MFLAEAVLRLRPERTLDHAREFEATVRTLLEEGANGEFCCAEPERDAALFALALSPFVVDGLYGLLQELRVLLLRHRHRRQRRVGA